MLKKKNCPKNLEMSEHVRYMEKYYKVSESELRELIHDSMMFCALQNGGVDNWEWYGESIHHFLEENAIQDEDEYDIAERILNENYVKYK